ncbi:hypothetical protein H8E06_00765 [bacterium]|nr:hypothetical protein [bacterium]
MTTDTAGIGSQGGYNDGDARIPYVVGTFKRFFDDWSEKKKKNNGKQAKDKRKKLRKGSSKTSFGSI